MLNLLLQSEARTVIVTQELLDAGKSVRGQWNHEQLGALGVPLPLRSGWRMKLLGRRVSRDDAIRFLTLKDAHLTAQPA
jgi:hypothetical protein